MQHSESGEGAGLPSVRLDTFGQAGAKAAHRLSSLSNWPHRPEDWQLMLRLGHGIGAYDPDGLLVGTALWWAYGGEAGACGMILVDPMMQHRGLGKRLMTSLLDSVADRRLLLYSTEAGRKLYMSCGFHDFGYARQYQGICHGAMASPRVRAARPEDYARIHEYDTAAFGFPRERLITGLLANGAAFVIETAGHVSGFAIRRRFGRGDLIGPVVAGSVQDTLELVAASLGTGFNRIDVANDDPHISNLLLRLGLADAGGVVAMVRGDWPPISRDVCRFALASQAFG